MHQQLFYEDYVTRGVEIGFAEDRLQRVARRIPANCESVLDVGCGNGRNLQFLRSFLPAARLCGAEIAEQGVEAIRGLGFEAVQCDASVHVPFEDRSFEAVLCGEMIEHVIDTDGLLREIKRVLKPGGTFIVTTPNLAYAVNRVLMLFGIQPIFTETSTQQNLGRVFSFLGQGKPTQGHLKLFTMRSLREILELCGFDVVAVEGYSIMPSGIAGVIDRQLRRNPSLAAGLIAEARPRP